MSKQESWFWSFIHNAVIHPVMAFSKSKLVDKAHDWTAAAAWPKPETEQCHCQCECSHCKA